MKNQDEKYFLKCKHEFHKKCFNLYLKEQDNEELLEDFEYRGSTKSNCICPLCKAKSDMMDEDDGSITEVFEIPAEDY
jgi:hypothetical protein